MTNLNKKEFLLHNTGKKRVSWPKEPHTDNNNTIQPENNIHYHKANDKNAYVKRNKSEIQCTLLKLKECTYNSMHS